MFGALVDPLSFTTWELHAWGYIMLLPRRSVVQANLIDTNDCFVEASVDVVNNEWLSAPGAYVDWMENPILQGMPSPPPTRAPSSPSQHRRDADRTKHAHQHGRRRPVGRRLLNVNKLSEDLR